MIYTQHLLVGSNHSSASSAIIHNIYIYMYVTHSPINNTHHPNLAPLYHHLLAFESPFSCFWKSFFIYYNFLSLPFSLLSCDCENVKDMKLLKVIHRNKIINNHLLISLSLYAVQAVLWFFFSFSIWLSFCHK